MAKYLHFHGVSRAAAKRAARREKLVQHWRSLCSFAMPCRTLLRVKIRLENPKSKEIPRQVLVFLENLEAWC